MNNLPNRLREVKERIYVRKRYFQISQRRKEKINKSEKCLGF